MYYFTITILLVYNLLTLENIPSKIKFDLSLKNTAKPIDPKLYPYICGIELPKNATV